MVLEDFLDLDNHLGVDVGVADHSAELFEVDLAVVIPQQEPINKF